MLALNEKTGKPQIIVELDGFGQLLEYQEALINIIAHACADHDVMNDREFSNIIFYVSQILKAALTGNSKGFSIQIENIENLETYQCALTEILSAACSSEDERYDFQFPTTIFYITEILKSCLLDEYQLQDYEKMGRKYLTAETIEEVEEEVV